MICKFNLKSKKNMRIIFGYNNHPKVNFNWNAYSIFSLSWILKLWVDQNRIETFAAYSIQIQYAYTISYMVEHRYNVYNLNTISILKSILLEILDAYSIQIQCAYTVYNIIEHVYDAYNLNTIRILKLILLEILVAYSFQK